MKCKISSPENGAVRQIDYSPLLSVRLTKGPWLLESQFSKKCELVLPISTSSTVSFPYDHPVDSSSSSSSSNRFNLSFNNVFQKAVPTQDATKPVSLPSFYSR